MKNYFYTDAQKGVEMTKIYYIITSLMLIIFGGGTVFANEAVIHHIKTGETGYATREYVDVFNNSEADIDVTGWCLVYSSASDAAKTTLACLDDAPTGYRLMLTAGSHMRFASQDFATANPGFIPDKIFSAGVSGTAGHIRILDALKQEVDKVGWGTAGAPEQVAAVAPTGAFVLSRKPVIDLSILSDTDNNAADFLLETLLEFPGSGVYEEIVMPDICSNIEGVQEVMPDGLELAEKGFCIEPSEQPQTQNLVVEISEVLPNVSGSDTGKEFIELYNPNDQDLNVAGWQLELGPDFTKTATLPNLDVRGKSYLSLSDAITGITLPNTSASLRLRSSSGAVVSEMPAYHEPSDDHAWANVAGIWQYTAMPTPGLQNSLPAQIDPAIVGTASILDDCGEGKFRNPETNRCKTIEVTAANACPEGQERNPETNRCRKIDQLVTALAACKAGQERNPETNRCRSVVASAALKPCAAGEERNPQTNRCKKVDSVSGLLTSVKDSPSTPSKSAVSLPWILAGLAIVAAGGYGVYEWRSELKRGLEFIARGQFIRLKLRRT